MNQANNKNICIWALSDGKPGHQNQTDGLIQALLQYREVELIRMPIVSYFSALIMLIIKKCGRVSHRSPDIIIGAGHRMHMSLLAYRHCFGGRIVIMMSPSLPLSFFDLCFIPRHDSPPKVDNVIEILGAINRVTPSQSQSLCKGLVLIGGPSNHFDWDSSSILQQIESLILKLKEKGVYWTVASSRRTPLGFKEAFKKKFPKVKFVSAEDTTADWLPKTMQKSGQIWVTEDSVSMIYEALTSGANTGIIRLTSKKETRVTKEICRLISEGAVQLISSLNMEITQPIIYEADRCAKLLIQKFNL